MKKKQTASDEPGFGHSPKTIAFWRKLVQRLPRTAETPLYLFSAEPVAEALKELSVLDRTVGVPVRHWFSCKTQPLRPLLQWWRRSGRSIEVVSEFEFLAAVAEGFSPDQILVNGPAKQRWLPRHARPGLWVNFDSIAEARALLPLARQHRWKLGVRCLTSEEFDAETPEHPTQFGLPPAEAVGLLRHLLWQRLDVTTLHLHLRTNVADAAIYARACDELRSIATAARWEPQYLDLGGGLPPHHTQSRTGQPYDAAFDMQAWARVLAEQAKRFPQLQELWLENGRFLTARSGVLVVKILDVKERRGLRQLICDGGRTMNALVSNWEDHALFSEPQRHGSEAPTAVYGPTCMAFDQLARRSLPRSLRAGDSLIWLDAGAYHLSWETHFSHGLAAVWWHEGDKLQQVRTAERFEDWWGRWS